MTHVFGIVSVHNLPIYDAHQPPGPHHARALPPRAGRRARRRRLRPGDGPARRRPRLQRSGYHEHGERPLRGPVRLVAGAARHRPDREPLPAARARASCTRPERQADMLRTVTRRVETVRRTEDIGSVLTAVAGDARTGPPPAGGGGDPDRPAVRHRRGGAPRRPPRSPASAVDGEPWPGRPSCSPAAERPLIWAGGGVVSADASAAGWSPLAERPRRPGHHDDRGPGRDPRGPPPGARRPHRPGHDARADHRRGRRRARRRHPLPELRHPGLAAPHPRDARPPRRRPRGDRAQLPRRHRRRRRRPPGPGAARRAAGTAGPHRSRLRRAGPASRVQADLEQSRRRARPRPLGDLRADAAACCPTTPSIVRDSTVPSYLWGNRVLPILRPRTSIRPVVGGDRPRVCPWPSAPPSAPGARTLLDRRRRRLPAADRRAGHRGRVPAPLVVCVFNDGGYGVLRVDPGRRARAHAPASTSTPPTSSRWRRAWASTPTA